MSRVNVRDLAGGLLVTAAGAAFALTAVRYPLGQPGAPGPGAFPMGVALFAVLMGLILCLTAVLRPVAGRLHGGHGALVAVLAAIAAFGMLIERIGLAPTVFVVVIVSALGSSESRPLHVLALALFMAVGCWLLFIEGLGMTLPAFRSPL